MITDKYYIRGQNESLILREIINKKNISRVELSNLTGLNKASVSSITKKLIDTKLVKEIGTGDGSITGGRKPILLAFNPKAASSISFDIGHNYIEGSLSYLDGEEIVSITKTDFPITKTNVLSLLNKMIQSLETKEPDSPHGIVGITIAIHGLVYNNHIIFTPHYDLDQINLAEELSQLVSYPIYIENEANLTAIGEYTFASNHNNLVCISIHNGIGAGIVFDGLIQTGNNGNAGEIGHSTLIPDGKLCPCGNRGCLELYTSNKSILQSILEVKKLDDINLKVAQQLFQKDDAETKAIMEKSAYYLSIGINNIITLYDPEVIIIQSPLYNEIPELLDIVTNHLQCQFSKKTTIQISSLNKKATLYGALAITVQHFLNIQQLKLL